MSRTETPQREYLKEALDSSSLRGRIVSVQNEILTPGPPTGGAEACRWD